MRHSRGKDPAAVLFALLGYRKASKSICQFSHCAHLPLGSNIHTLRIRFIIKNRIVSLNHSHHSPQFDTSPQGRCLYHLGIVRRLAGQTVQVPVFPLPSMLSYVQGYLDRGYLLRRQVVVTILVSVHYDAQTGRMSPQQLYQFICGHCFPPAWAAAILTLPPLR